MGELLLLSNRIAVADRNMGYVVPFLLEINRGDLQEKTARFITGLSGNNISDLKDADLGYASNYNYTANVVNNDNDLTAQTDWGNIYSTALSISGIEFPSFISGMLAAASFFSGDPVRNEDYVYTAGALTDEQKQRQLGRHFLIVRESDIGYRNAVSEKMLETAFKLSGENILGNPPLGNAQNVDITQKEYSRAFGTFFSDAQ